MLADVFLATIAVAVLALSILVVVRREPIPRTGLLAHLVTVGALAAIALADVLFPEADSAAAERALEIVSATALAIAFVLFAALYRHRPWKRSEEEAGAGEASGGAALDA